MADESLQQASAREVVESLSIHFRTRRRHERDRLFDPAMQVLAEVIVTCLDQCGFVIFRKPPARAHGDVCHPVSRHLTK